MVSNAAIKPPLPVRPFVVMYRRRISRRRSRVPRRIATGATALTLRRSGTPVAIALVAGGANGLIRPKLSDCLTSDLQAIFNEYRLLKCVIRWSKRSDPGNSLNANQTCLIQVANACDPEGVTPTAFNEVTSYANYRRGNLGASTMFSYTFYPKVINNVAVVAGVSTASVGTYRTNPWIQCNAAGVTVENYALSYSLLSTLVTDTSTVEYCIDYHFQVRGIS